MIRTTSVAAYEKIKEGGLLNGLRLKVYEYLYSFGPCTQNEVYQAVFAEEHEIRSITPRFRELVLSGAIKAVGEREDVHTGNMSMVWDVTGEIPKPIDDLEWVVIGHYDTMLDVAAALDTMGNPSLDVFDVKVAVKKNDEDRWQFRLSIKKRPVEAFQVDEQRAIM